jgi:hypothetical protein
MVHWRTRLPIYFYFFFFLQLRHAAAAVCCLQQLLLLQCNRLQGQLAVADDHPVRKTASRFVNVFLAFVPSLSWQMISFSINPSN